jgi:pimeloyl-ACP methyl ester carboxylesterase
MIFYFGEYTIDAAAFEAFRAGERLPAEPQVLDLLIFLLQNRNRIVLKEEIFEVVWKGRLVAEATLSSRIKAVRQLIGDNGSTQRFVRTIHGRGFRFVHDVAVEASLADESHPSRSEDTAVQLAPDTRYAKSGDVHVAFHLFGSGPVNLVLAPGYVSHIDNYWDYPPLNLWLTKLGQMARVAMFDKRGTGLSDPVTELPDMDQRMDDVRAVMDAAGFDNAVIMGISEGGSLASLFAATHPKRTLGLVLYGAFAKFSSWFPTAESLEQLFAYIESEWGTGKSLPHYAPSGADDPQLRQWWGKFERFGATPAAAMALMRMNSEIDITETLATIQAPTLVLHRTGDVLVHVEGGRALGRNIPGAHLIEYPGPDHLPFVGDNVNEILEDIKNFIANLPAKPIVERILATLLVARLDETALHGISCERRGEDHRQRDRILRHALTRYGGNEVKLTGTRLVAAFDGPTRALGCALSIVEEFEKFHLPIRIGIHTGELQDRDRDLSGVALDIASRIADTAQENGVIASRTVKDLVAGSGIGFEDVGAHALPGFAEPWRMFRVMG